MGISNYAHKYYQWDENNPSGYNNRMGWYKTKKEYQFINKYLSDKIIKILDIGGGSGRFALPIMKSGFDITVIDLDKSAIEICREKGIAKAFCVDARYFNQNNFDIALAIELFLVTPPEEIFVVANKVLNMNGLLIFVGTNKESWRYKLHNLKKNKSKNFGELSLYEYKTLIDHYGFDVIDIKGFNWMPFSVNSNNSLIPAFSKIESCLKLDKWLNQSPWFLMACKKTRNIK